VITDETRSATQTRSPPNGVITVHARGLNAARAVGVSLNRSAGRRSHRLPGIEISMITTKRLPMYIVIGAVISALAVIVALTVSHSSAKGAKVNAAPKTTVVKTRTTKYGQILVDAQGRTLYLFEKDNGMSSSCSGSCASYWPPVPVAGQPQGSGGAMASSIAVISRSGGHKQLTYAGHPLYYFIGDHKAGQTSGQGLDQFGAKWYVLDATGAAVTSAPSNGNQGGGY
jgi:predicted lipoprotein with Yx(FWY)xxD motif